MPADSRRLFFFGLFPVQEKMSAGKKRLYVAKTVKIAKIEV